MTFFDTFFSIDIFLFEIVAKHTETPKKERRRGRERHKIIASDLIRCEFLFDNNNIHKKSTTFAGYKRSK